MDWAFIGKKIEKGHKMDGEKKSKTQEMNDIGEEEGGAADVKRMDKGYQLGSVRVRV